MGLFRVREQESEIVVSPEESSSVDWRKAKPRSFGTATGVSRQNSLFWARLSELEYVPLLDVIEKALEAHGWELNLENLLFALGSSRIGRKTQGLAKNAKHQPVAFEAVYTFELPQKGRSGRLLRLLYAALDPSKKVADKETSSGAKGKTEQFLRDQNLKLQQNLEELKADVASLRAGIAASNLQIAHLAREAVASLESKQELVGRPSKAPSTLDPQANASDLKLSVLEVREIDFDQRSIRLRGDGRSFDSSFDDLLLFPEKGCQAIGVFEKKTLVRLVPIGMGWREYRYRSAKVIASSGKRLKLITDDRMEFLMDSDLFSQGRQSRLRRGELIVCRFVGNLPIAVCLHEDGEIHKKQRYFQIQFEEALQGQIRRGETHDPDAAGEKKSQDPER